MAQVISITKNQRNGAYADVVEFVNDVARPLGSATNATAVLLRKTDEYRDWQRRMTRRKRKAG